MATVNNTSVAGPDQMKFGHTWRSGNGELHATVEIGYSWIVVDSAAEAAQMAISALLAAVALDRLGSGPETTQSLKTADLDGFRQTAAAAVAAVLEAAR